MQAIHQLLAILLCFIASCLALIAQNNPDELFEEALCLGENKKDIPLAIDVLKKAVTEYEQTENWEEIASCYNEISINYIKTKKYKEVIDFCAMALEQLEQASFKNNVDIANIYFNQGIAYRRLEKYVESLEAYKEALNIYQEQDYFDDWVALTYRNAAFNCSRLLNYKLQLEYLNIPLQRGYKGKYAVSLYNSLASRYNYMEKEEKAWNTYQKALAISKSKKDTALLNATGAGILLKDKKYDEALKLIEYSNVYYKENKPTYLPDSYKITADIYAQKGAINRALSFYNKALELTQQNKKNKNRSLASLYVHIGGFYEQNNKTSEALQQYQKALIQVIPNFNSENTSDNPSLASLHPESYIMTAAARKADLLSQLYQEKKEVNYLKDAAYCYQVSLEATRLIKQTYGADEAKEYLGAYNYKTVEKNIQCHYDLYQLTNDNEYLETAFENIERSKANVLTEAINKNKTAIFTNVPDSLMGRERTLRVDIADAKKSLQIHQYSMAPQDTQRIKKLESQLSNFEQSYDYLLHHLKKEYPKFEKSLHQFDVPKLNFIQNSLLKDQQTLLEYFWGEKHLYAVSINKFKTKIHQIAIDSILIDLLNQFFAYFENAGRSMKNNPLGYEETAYQLYKKIYAPFVESANTSVLIIPDGPLNFIPFDALITQTYKRNNPQEFAYLLHQQAIHYAYSATILCQKTLVKSNVNKNLMAVAPIFKKKERNLATLEHSKEELNKIKQSLGTLDKIIAEEATLAKFKKQASAYKIIHLSTHANASVDTSDPPPHIEFFDQALYLPELYAMQLPANLVVLSACQTGLGKIQKGEGAMSLARGFSYAGVGALLSSLWSVNHKSSTDLVQLFYQNLASGASQAQALHQAKKHHIQHTSQSSYALPYYWAALVYIENQMDSKLSLNIEPTTNESIYNNACWYLILSAFLVLGAFLFRKVLT